MHEFETPGNARNDMYVLTHACLRWLWFLGMALELSVVSFTTMIKNIERAMYIPWNSSSTSIPVCLHFEFQVDFRVEHSNSMLGNGAPHLRFLVWSSITTQLTPLQFHAWNSIHIVRTWGTWISMFVIPHVDFLCLEFYSWRPVDKWNS